MGEAVNRQERAADWRQPPAAMRPEAGRVSWAPVDVDGIPVGAVWGAHGDIPNRSGIILKAGALKAAKGFPATVFQDELGMVAVAARSVPFAEWDPVEWLGYLAETRTGSFGRCHVGDIQAAMTLAAVYEAMGHTS